MTISRAKLAELFWYGVFGVLTTVLNIFLFWLLTAPLGIHYLASNFVAWLVCVVFAFVTNKLFVFKSRSFARAVWLREAAQFVSARIATCVMDFAILYAMVELIGTGEMPAKVTANAAVIIGNYILSKMWIFKGR